MFYDISNDDIEAISTHFACHEITFKVLFFKEFSREIPNFRDDWLTFFFTCYHFNQRKIIFWKDEIYTQDDFGFLEKIKIHEFFFYLLLNELSLEFIEVRLSISIPT